MAPATVFIVLYCFPALIFFSFLPILSASQSSSILPWGSSLSVEKEADVLVSPDKAFTCGFHGVGENAFAFSIWFTASAQRTPVWTANRDRPVNGRGSRLTLRRDGALALLDADKMVVWSTNTSSTDAAVVQLLETGNLVVKDPADRILWQSFASPTNTLLPTQLMTKTTKLVSSMSPATIIFTGYYTLSFDNDNVLKLMYDGPEVSSIYWPNPDLVDHFRNGRSVFNSSRLASLDESGRFLSSDWLDFHASDAGPGIKRRLTLDPDGNLRLYSLNESTGNWRISWLALAQVCKVHGQCGKNGICVPAPEAKCFCPPGHKIVDPTNWKKGCRRNVDISCGHPAAGPWRFVEIPHTDFYGYDTGYSSNISFDSCRRDCENDCACQGFVYKRFGQGVCYPKSLLFNGFRAPSFEGSVFLKLPRSRNEASPALSVSGPPVVSEIVCTADNASGIISSADSVVPSSSGDFLQGNRRKESNIWVFLYGFVSALGLIELLFIVTGYCFLRGRQRSQRTVEEGYRMVSDNFRKFSFKELKQATQNFKHELGRGGAGAVYKGVLADQRPVAVKKLDNVVQGTEEFQTEMNLIGRIYHMNLVRVWGFCSEGAHRLLVAELQERGSLAQMLFGSDGDGVLEWSNRYKIALGTAKGLAYLHHECLEWVVHCDVKPENILLDRDFEPKIADFGLAKLSQRGPNSDIDFSRIRGTKGYMAPEWITRAPITAKVDVYSYGVVLLEIVMGRRISDHRFVAAGEEDVVAELRKLVGRPRREQEINTEEEEYSSWADNFVDPRLGGHFNRKQAAVMLEMGVLCTEEETSKRPSVDFVAQTLLSCENFLPEVHGMVN